MRSLPLIREPLIGAAKPLLYRHGGRPAQLASDLFDVHDAAADVVDIAPVDPNRFNAGAGDLQYQPGELVHGCLAAGSYVVHLAFGLWRECRQQSPFHHVVYVGEIAGLFAVAVYSRRLGRHGRFEEFRDHAAVRIIGSLGRPIHIRISDDPVDSP